MFRFLLGLILCLWTGLAVAQKAGSSLLAAKAIEDAATQILGRNLKPDSFQVIATVTLDEGRIPRSALIPGLNQEYPLATMSLERLMPLLTSVNLEVLLDEAYGANVRSRLADILSKKLRMNAARGDRVAFTNLGIPTESATMREDLSKAERQLQDLQNKLEVLQREDRQKDMMILDLKKQSLAAAAAPAPAPLPAPAPVPVAAAVEKKAEALKTETTVLPPAITPKEEPVQKWAPIFLPLALLVVGLFFILTSSKNHSQASERMSEAVGSIARSMGKMSAGRDAPVEAPVPAAATVERKAEDSSPRRMGPDAILAFKQRLFELQSELEISFHSDGKTFMVQHINSLVKNQASRAILLMEGLGKEIAAKIFEGLDMEAQSAIVDSMRNMSFEGNKYEVMLQLAEELKTLLIVNNLQVVQFAKDQNLASAMGRLRENQVERVAAALQPKALGRFLAYVDPKLIATLLKRSNNENLKQTILKTLPHIPELAKSGAEDASILAAIRAAESDQDDNARLFFNYYKELIESSEDEIAEIISSQLTKPTVKEYLSENVVTFNMLFRLKDDILEEIMSQVSLKDFALLLKHLSQQQQAKLLTVADERRRELVAEEYASIRDQSPRMTQQKYQAVRGRILDRLRKLQRDGLLTDMMEAENGGARGAA